MILPALSNLNCLQIAFIRKKKRLMSNNIVFLKDNRLGMNKKQRNYK